MKQGLGLLLGLFICFCPGILNASEYKETEMIALPWGGQESQIPYFVDKEGVIHGPVKFYVDNKENIYFSIPYSEYYKSQFRKYNSFGELIYNNYINIYKYAVDDSQNLFFTIFDIRQLHIVKILDKQGNLDNRTIPFSINNINNNISWIKSRKGKIVAGNLNFAAEVSKSGLSETEYQIKNPVDSKGIYYFTETHMGMSIKQQQDAISYNKNFVHLYKFYFSGSELAKKDTVELNICRFSHLSAEVLQIDENDNFYIWVYYSDELPIDLVVLDNGFNEINRIEFNAPLIESFGIWMKRPFITTDGNVYEFRCLDDGLHVIRWSREE